MAERALAAGLGERGKAGEGDDEGTGERDDERASESGDKGALEGADSRDDEDGMYVVKGRKPEDGEAAAPISGTRAERYQVMLHVDADTLSATAEPGRSELEDGTRVSAETSRRLACDAALVRVTRARDGAVVDASRCTRTIPPALRRALEARDRGCRFPGCGLRFTDAHHIVHWADGGPTTRENCLLLCRHHHRLVHEGCWRVEWWGPNAVFRDRRGGIHVDGDRGRSPDLGPRPAEALVRQNRLRGIDPDGWSAAVRWKREADIPDGVLFRAIDAVLEAEDVNS